MVDDTEPPWDDLENGDDVFDDGHDDLAALDFSVPEEREDDDDDAPPLFTVTNPAGTVSVTTYLNGCVQSVDLAPNVTTMTERQLADEVLVIADLARQKAQSVLHAFMLDGMQRHGYDTAGLSTGMTRHLGMPTPEQADQAAAQVFMTRYGREQD